MEPPLPQVQLKEMRERTVARLCEAFAQDRLEVGELEARIDLAHRAATPTELSALVQDLAPVADGPVAAAPTPVRDSLARGGHQALEAIRESRTFLAFMGGVERKGSWTPARRNVVIAMMGGADLDFREVDLPPGVTEIFVFAMMGGVEILVGPDVHVDASGIAIMGGFGHASAPRDTHPDTPVLRISGFCMMGGVDITVRLPGESAKDARLRRRDEKKRRTEEQKRLRGME